MRALRLLPPSMKSVSFILWQRLAAEAEKNRMREVVEAQTAQLQTKEEELSASQAQCAAREEEFKAEVATLKEANEKAKSVKGVNEVMTCLRTRRVAGAFSRWNCAAVQLCEEKRVSELKDAERAQVVEAMRQEAEEEKARHEQSVQALKTQQQERGWRVDE